MVEYLDNEGNRLEKGFYFFEKFSDLYYFSDKYNSNGFPIFEHVKRIGKKINLQAYLTRRLNKLNKKQIENIIKESKNKINWLEQKLEE